MTFNNLYHPVHLGRDPSSALELPGNLFLAPIAGYSDRAFRSICVDGGADFCYTEMVSAEALSRGNKKTENLMKCSPNESAYAVQIFGGNPEGIAGASRIVLSKTTAECIDINGGCPVPKIIKTGAGASLTRDPALLYDIVRSAVDAVSSYTGARPCYLYRRSRALHVPVTIKIRTGWDIDHITWKDAARKAIDAGAAAITLHARTRTQGYAGKADWGVLKELVKYTGGVIPIFGSGDVFSPQDAKNMLEQTKCDAVMFARGAMHQPFIFRQTKQYLLSGTFDKISDAQRIKAGFRELELLVQDTGERDACLKMRKRFCAYAKGIKGGSEIRRKIVFCNSVSEYKEAFAPILFEKEALIY